MITAKRIAGLWFLAFVLHQVISSQLTGGGHIHLKLPSLEGPIYNLEDYKGKVVVVEV